MRPRLSCLLLSILAGIHLPLAAADDAADPNAALARSESYQEGTRAFMNQDYKLACRYYLATHAEQPDNTLLYFRLGEAHQQAGRLLAAMAWYQAYAAAWVRDADRSANAHKRIQMLAVDVRAKMDQIFTQALSIAEAGGVPTDMVARMKLSFAALTAPAQIARAQARAGEYEDAKETFRRARELGYQLGGFMPEPYTPYSLEQIYFSALADAGDIGALRRDYPRWGVTDNACAPQVVALGEIINFVHSATGGRRVHLAEQLSADDPMADLDVTVAGDLRGSAKDEIPVKLALRAAGVGQILLQIQGEDPREVVRGLSSDALAYLKQYLGMPASPYQIHLSGRFLDPGYDSPVAPVVLRAANLLSGRQTGVGYRGVWWPPIALAWYVVDHKEELRAIDSPERMPGLLEQAGVGVNSPDPNGYSALDFAALSLNVEAVKTLLKHGANPNYGLPGASRGLNRAGVALLEALPPGGFSGQTALDLAIMNNEVAPDDPKTVQWLVDVVRALLAAGADVNAATADRYTALHFAADRGLVDVARVLLDHGADAAAQTTSHQTPLQLAEAGGFTAMADLLRKATAPNAQN